MIVDLTPPTAEEFKTLYDETGWGDWPLSRFEAALAGSWVVCTARDESGNLVGMGRIISDGAMQALIADMIVSESARGGGLSARILRRLVDEARSHGLAVKLFAADGRAGFYERNGFVRRPDTSPGMELADES
jgi:GNAT superfamily N-acetyltransferase